MHDQVGVHTCHVHGSIAVIYSESIVYMYILHYVPGEGSVLASHENYLLIQTSTCIKPPIVALPTIFFSYWYGLIIVMMYLVTSLAHFSSLPS